MNIFIHLVPVLSINPLKVIVQFFTGPSDPKWVSW